MKQNRTRLDEGDAKDGIAYDKFGRMKYHSDFHPNHGKPFTTDELIYMCKYYEIDGPRSVSFAIGKTELTIMDRVCTLRKNGLFEQFKKMSEDEWLKVAK